MAIDRVADKRYPVVNGGVCIYCGSDGGAKGLGDEHIIPFALGGNTVLEKASCHDCGAVTSYIDGYVARQIFGHFRVHTRVQTRSGHPELLPILIERDGKEEIHELPVHVHPYFLNMPIWGLPGFMRGRTLDADFGFIDKHVYYNVPRSLRKTLGLKDWEAIKITDVLRDLNHLTFARQLMKIAYCDGIRRYGLNNFRPLASPDIIIGRYPNIAYFVGVEPGLPPPDREGPAEHMVRSGRLNYGRLSFLYATIRLFCGAGYKEFGMPVYRVLYGVAGKRRISQARPLLGARRAIAL